MHWNGPKRFKKLAQWPHVIEDFSTSTDKIITKSQYDQIISKISCDVSLSTAQNVARFIQACRSIMR